MNMLDKLGSRSLKKGVTAVLVIWGIKILVNFVKKNERRTYLKSLAQKARAERDLQIAKEYTDPNEISEEKRQLILKSTASELMNLLNDDKITSVEILKIYHSRAITIGLRFGLIAQSNYPEALELAKKYDEIRIQTPKEERSKLGVLFGLPISVKDSFDQKNLTSTCGLSTCLKEVRKDDGEVIKILKKQGAIPFIRSNIPQTLLGMQTNNFIWGRGLNPWNTLRSVGGSSGGEGGLIASKCSPLGFGSDALGSLRIPATFCGVYTLKPSKGRTCRYGHTKTGVYSHGKYTLINEAYGPMARCVDDCALLFKSLTSEDNSKYDPTNPQVLWKEEVFKSTEKLKIAYMPTNEFLGNSKTSIRAVNESADALKKSGHELVEVKIPRFAELVLLTVRLVVADGKARSALAALDGEDPVNEIKTSMLPRYIPDFMAPILSFILKSIGEIRASKVVAHIKDSKAHEYLALAGEIVQVRDEIFRWWNENGFDGIILPSVGLPACIHGVEDTYSVGYMFPANICNVVAGIVPVTKVREEEEILASPEYQQKDSYFKKASKIMKNSKGMPMSVQIWTLPFQEEKCLSIMKALENEINFHELPVV